MKRIIIPPEGKEDQARFRAEKDEWLLLATSKEATKAVHRIAPFIFVRLNAERADFHWGVKGIADALGMSVAQVERGLSWLRERGLIVKQGREGRHGTSIYALGLPCVAPSQREGSNELIDPSPYEVSSEPDDLSTPHFGPIDPSLSGRRSLTLRGTNPVRTPEEPEGCAPEAQQPSGSFPNPGAHFTECVTGDYGSTEHLGAGDRHAFKADEAPSGDVTPFAGEDRDRKAAARDILAEAGFTEDRMQQAARDRHERKKVNWYA